MIPLIPTPDRCTVMGVINVTPDSFSDGGRYNTPAEAVAAGRAMLAGGADLIDVGGESTRPSAERVSEQEELTRALPVVEELAAQGAPVSIDTTRAAVAVAAVAAGAVLVNDVSGGLSDPDMLPAVAELGVPVVVMHWRAPSRLMQHFAYYVDVVEDVRAALCNRLEACLAAGIPLDRVILDPGLGFAKQVDHNWQLLAALPELLELGQPVLIGASRKRFLGELLAGAGGAPRPERERDAATTAVSALAAAAGVWGVRVHDVPASRDAVDVGRAWRKAVG